MQELYLNVLRQNKFWKYARHKSPNVGVQLISSFTCSTCKYYQIPSSIRSRQMSDPKKINLRLVFTCDGVRVGVDHAGRRKRPYDLVKIENRSCKPSHKWNQSRKNQNVSISSNSVYDSITYDPVKTRLSQSEAEAEEPANRKALSRIIVIGLF